MIEPCGKLGNLEAFAGVGDRPCGQPTAFAGLTFGRVWGAGAGRSGLAPQPKALVITVCAAALSDEPLLVALFTAQPVVNSHKHPTPKRVTLFTGHPHGRGPHEGPHRELHCRI